MSTSYQIVPVRTFADNYVWILRAGDRAAVVDPGDALPVLNYLDAQGLSLVAILATHHHADHVGGVSQIISRVAVPVHGPAREPIAELTHRIVEGDRVEIPEIGASFTVLEVPGHTRAHVAYYDQKALFCGDTLFGCGCGRVFEGTAGQMYASLQKLAALPDDTLVYCAHEYTLANIAFAKQVEPDNPALGERERTDAASLARGLPTLPSTIGREKATNPFLRCAVPAVIASANKYLGTMPSDPAGVFSALREWKNRF